MLSYIRNHIDRQSVYWTIGSAFLSIGIWTANSYGRGLLTFCFCMLILSISHICEKKSGEFIFIISVIGIGIASYINSGSFQNGFIVVGIGVLLLGLISSLIKWSK